MSTVSGVVGWVGQNKFGKYSIKLEGNDNWYNSNYEIKASKGDTVEFDDGGKKYCSKLRVISSGGKGSTTTTKASSGRGVFPVPALDGSRAIIRQNAVTNANAFFTNNEVKYSVEDLIDVAKEIEAYTSGDMDAEAAHSKMADAFEPAE